LRRIDDPSGVATTGDSKKMGRIRKGDKRWQGICSNGGPKRDAAKVEDFGDDLSLESAAGLVGCKDSCKTFRGQEVGVGREEVRERVVVLDARDIEQETNSAISVSGNLGKTRKVAKGRFSNHGDQRA
jgi:hypothetical protein